jgi:hypothetical protein
MFAETKQDILHRTHKAYIPLTDCLSYKSLVTAIIYRY